MAILFMITILWMPFVVTRLIGAQHARAVSSAYPRQAYPDPRIGAEAETVSRDGSLWTALDDRQLTRLLTDSTPPDSPSNKTPV